MYFFRKHKARVLLYWVSYFIILWIKLLQSILFIFCKIQVNLSYSLLVLIYWFFLFCYLMFCEIYFIKILLEIKKINSFRKSYYLFFIVFERLFIAYFYVNRTILKCQLSISNSFMFYFFINKCHKNIIHFINVWKNYLCIIFVSLTFNYVYCIWFDIYSRLPKIRTGLEM